MEKKRKRPRSTSTTTTSHYLPEDLIIDIQRRLPPSCLRRLCCVNKSWNSNLSNPNFIYRNLFYGAADTAADTQLLVTIPDRRYERFDYTCLSYDSLLPSNNNNIIESAFRKHLLGAPICCPLIFGTSRGGLLCLEYTDKVCVFNPATSETKMLPPIPPHPDCNSSTFDRCLTLVESDDDGYKLVSVRHYLIGLDIMKKFHVFSSDNESLGWREFLAPSPPNSTFYNSILWEIRQYGCTTKKKKCYWLEKGSRFSNGINLISFDSSAEVFSVRETAGSPPFPCKVGIDGIWYRPLVYMAKDETLVVFDTANDVWVLQQWGSESWCKLSLSKFSNCGGTSHLIPIGLAKHGKVICREDGKKFEDGMNSLQVVDVITGEISVLPWEVKDVGHVHVPGAQVTTYVPSKMSLSSGRMTKITS
ncbi:Putative F-box protein At1g19160 [Linum grandiflorum]